MRSDQGETGSQASHLEKGAKLDHLEDAFRYGRIGAAAGSRPTELVAPLGSKLAVPLNAEDMAQFGMALRLERWMPKGYVGVMQDNVLVAVLWVEQSDG